MKKTEIFFPFKPVPKGRPRFTRSGHSYTPKATSDYEKKIAEYYSQMTDDYYDGPIKIRLIFYMPIPKSESKKRKLLMETNEIKHIKKPDADNLIKAITDSVNGLAYRDDSLITHITAEKRYASDANVGTAMTICEDVD